MASIDTFGPKLKVARAKRHIADLQHIIDAFFSDNPYSIAFEPDPNSQGWRVALEFKRSIPNDSATVIGDIIHNLRSSLDLLASNAVRAAGLKPTRNTGFPIYLDEAGFNGGTVSKLAGAPQPFIDFVAKAKPYRTAIDGSHGDLTLWTLAQLDNDDKHITLLPVAGVAKLSNVEFIHRDGPEHGYIKIGSITVPDGNITGGIGIGMPRLELKRAGDATFFVRLDHRQFLAEEDVLSAARRIEARVSEIIAEAGKLSV